MSSSKGSDTTGRSSAKPLSISPIVTKSLPTKRSPNKPIATNPIAAKPLAAKLSPTKPIATKHEEYQPDIIEIGRMGRIPKNSRHKYRPHREDDPIARPKTMMNQLMTPSIYRYKDLNEIPKSEIIDEVIDPDIQYFLAFCSLLYLVRAVYMTYHVIVAIERHKFNYATNFDLAVFLLNLLFTIVLYFTAGTGYTFCWKMNLKFAIPFMLFMILSTLLIGAKLAILFMWFEEDTSSKRKKEEQGVYESAFDCLLLVLNIVISFCITKMYEQISESSFAVEHEPDQILVDGKTYDKAVANDMRVSYIARKTLKAVITSNA